MKRFLPLLIVGLLVFPTFMLMLQQGIFSMQDFHYFRLVEFDKCIRDLQIPCRWSAEAGLGFGEPLFNFYGQGAYILGSIFHFLFLSYVNSLKLLFIISLLGSALSMFFLSRKLWKNDIAAILSSIVYVYAPYRAIDVWVRGALPEALSFVLYPLIILFFENYIEKGNKRQLLLFSLSLALLVLTHNLSALMFVPFLIIWVVFRTWEKKKAKFLPKILLGGILALGIAAFYLLPVIFESKYITLDSTTQGYFDFRGHFATISQLLFSRYWGYGASLWGPEDEINLSVGLFQWVIPVSIFVYLLFKRQIHKYKSFVVLLILGIFYLFLTHNKSTVIWISIDQLKYIQFPWRFLGMAVFSFALASGVLMTLISKKFLYLVFVLIGFVIIYNISFFRPDLWFAVKDSDLTSGPKWTEQTRASIGDFWPKDAGVIPYDPAKSETVDYKLIEKKSNMQVYKIYSDSDSIDFPINPFPGWEQSVSGDQVVFEFKNTPIRALGNLISIASIIILTILLIV